MRLVATAPDAHCWGFLPSASNGHLEGGSIQDIMSLVKSAARRLQSHPTFALLVSIFFALTGLQLASVFSRTNFPEPHYGLCATYRSIVAFASHPYMLLKRVSLHFEGKDSGVRSLRKLDSQKYWETVARNRKRFRRNEARPVDDPFDLESGNASTRVEYLITYYKPQLLPQYREPRKPDPDALELVIPSKVFIAWHALVYPNKVSP